jgi:hypothetical protein
LKQKYKMAVKINGQAVTNKFDSTIKSVNKKSTTLTPSSASPVLKTQIVIQLDSDFPHTLAKGDFTVNATSTTNSTYVRYLNVIKVDDKAKKLTVKFGGAKSGKF